MDDFPLLIDVSDKLSMMSTQEKYNLIYQNLPTVIAQGYNRSEAANTFRNYGYSFRDSEFTRLYNMVTDESTISSKLQYLPKDENIPTTAFKSASEFQENKYLYTAQIQILDRDRGGIFEVRMALDTDSSLTPYEAENAILDYFVEVYGRSRDILGTQLSGAYSK